MLKQPQTKYRAFSPIRLADRRWPDAVLTQAPICLSTDLRDDDQALIEPMGFEKKLRLFRLPVGTGFIPGLFRALRPGRLRIAEPDRA